jgi:hypothetical protein
MTEGGDDITPDSEARRRWTKEHTVFIGLKLNRRTDADILEALDPSKPKQAQIKSWIRQALSTDKK